MCVDDDLQKEWLATWPVLWFTINGVWIHSSTPLCVLFIVNFNNTYISFALRPEMPRQLLYLQLNKTLYSVCTLVFIFSWVNKLLDYFSSSASSIVHAKYVDLVWYGCGFSNTTSDILWGETKFRSMKINKDPVNTL